MSVVCSYFAVIFANAGLRSLFAKHQAFEQHATGETEYELRSDGLLRTTHSSRTLFYWSPGVQIETDTQRYFLSFGADALLVVPVQAFSTYAEFEAFGSTASTLAHGT